MSTDEYIDPLQYLNGLERLALGWFVARQFATNVPRFAKWVQSSGPEAMAHIACSRTLRLYGMGFVLLALMGQAARIGEVAYVLYGLAGVCAAWAVVCLLRSLKPQREYRREHEMRDGSAP